MIDIWINIDGVAKKIECPNAEVARIIWDALRVKEYEGYSLLSGRP